VKDLCVFCFVGFLVPLLISGCGGEPKATVSEKPSTVPLQQLPEVSDLIGPLDEGRLKAAAPKGWVVPPRSSEYIVRFKASAQTSYPTIIITGADYDPVFDVSQDNVAGFAKQIAADFEGAEGVSKLAKEISPLEIGQRWGITYGRRAKVKKLIVDRLFFETVVSGRKYNFELRTLKGTVGKYRPYLLAVVGGVKFLDSGTAQTAPADMEETPPDAGTDQEPPETPAESPPKKPTTTEPEEEDPFA